MHLPKLGNNPYKKWAVANLLRNKGYSYMIPQFLKGRELKCLKENYKNMTYSEVAEELVGTDAEQLLEDVISEMKIDIVREALRCLTSRNSKSFY